MKEKDVAYFGTLLNLKPEDVEKALEDGSLGDKIAALGIMTKDQVSTMKDNLAKEVKDEYFGELVEKAKKGELDQDLYKPIHGAVHEMIEKELVKTYGVEKGNLKDMIAKISNNGQSHDKEQLVQKIQDLQQVNENLVKEKDEAVKKAKSEYEGKVLMRDKTDQLNAVPFDFSDVDEDKLDKVKASRKQILNDVFDARFSLAFSDDKLVVKDREGKIRKNSVTLDPLPVSDVMKDLAAELGIKLKSPESGGQGGKSSGNTSGGRFKNTEEYEDYLDANNIKINTPEAIKIWSERRPEKIK